MIYHPSRSPNAEHMKPEEIQALRKQVGLTQEQFGDLVHSAGRTVQDWELGRRVMSIGTSELLCVALVAYRGLPPGRWMLRWVRSRIYYELLATQGITEPAGLIQSPSPVITL
jgi:transcriptional regulator with XRE-family HTH domain